MLDNEYDSRRSNADPPATAAARTRTLFARSCYSQGIAYSDDINRNVVTATGTIKDRAQQGNVSVSHVNRTDKRVRETGGVAA